MKVISLCFMAAFSLLISSLVLASSPSGEKQESPSIALDCKGKDLAQRFRFLLRIDKLEGATTVKFLPVERNQSDRLAAIFPFSKPVQARGIKFTTVSMAPDRSMQSGAVFAYFDVVDGRTINFMSVIGHIKSNRLSDFWVSREFGRKSQEFDCNIVLPQSNGTAT